MKTESETQIEEPKIIKVPTKVDIKESISVSEFVYPKEGVLDNSYHIYISISACNLKLSKAQEEMVRLFVTALKEELLTP